MITNLKIRNFKALQEADVPLRPLSLFTGLNGMGKSTLMQAILMLRQSYQQQSLQNPNPRANQYPRDRGSHSKNKREKFFDSQP